MPKVYAVKEGKTKGIFTSWNECQEQVKGYKGAQFKSFNNIEDAKEYLGELVMEEEPIEKGLSLKEIEQDEAKYLLEQIIEQAWNNKPELIEDYVGSLCNLLDIEIIRK